MMEAATHCLVSVFHDDGDGNLVKKIKPDGSKTIYVGGVYEVDKTSGGSTTRTVTYYPVASAMRIDSTLYYILKDHLGSASVVTDASGNIIGEQRYYPFGETRFTTGTIYTDRLFTGQREMAGLGIYHFNARFYSPKLGRFLSADTLVSNPLNPQTLNRFSYVRNNPLRYTDPTGHVECRTQEECQDMGTTPGGGFSIPKPKSGGGGGGVQDPPGHDYDNDTLVCPAWVGCTQEEMTEYLTHFQYPGQAPWSPVTAGYDYIVFPARLWNIPNPVFYLLGLEDLGAIRVTAENNGSTLINRTQETHIFHNGVVERSLYQDEYGAWHVATHGTGTNIWTPYDWANNTIDFINDKAGEPVFDLVDLQLIVWVATDQTIDTIRDSVP